MSKWHYYEILDIVWKTFESSTRIAQRLNPCSKAGFKIRVKIISKERKITENEEGQKLVLTERKSLLR